MKMNKKIVEDDALDDDIASLSYGTMYEKTIDDDFVMPICSDPTSDGQVSVLK